MDTDNTSGTIIRLQPFEINKRLLSTRELNYSQAMGIFKITLFTISPLLFAFSCTNESEDANLLSNQFLEIEITTSCTFNPERKTVDSYDNEKGVIETVELTATKIVVTIRPERKSSKMISDITVPCNLPNYNFKKDHEVIFSGALKETFPTENIIGLSLELTSLKLRADE